MLTWLWISLAFAHKPFFGPFASADAAFEVDDIDISIVAYQQITCDDEALWMHFNGKAGDELYVQLGVPVIDRLADYRPSLAVFAPGLEARGETPYEAPTPLPARVYESNESPTDFYEPFTQTESWIWIEDTITLPQDGEGWIVAWSPENRTGKLWVAVGTVEDFSDVGVDEFGEWGAYLNDFHEKTSSPNIAAETICEEPEPEEASSCSTLAAAPVWLWAVPFAAAGVARRRRAT